MDCIRTLLSPLSASGESVYEIVFANTGEILNIYFRLCTVSGNSIFGGLNVIRDV